MAEIIFIICTVIVLMLAIQLIKKFANGFFEKISKFVPLLTAVIAFIASLIFYRIKAGEFLFVQALIYGYFIASAEVYTYEGIYKLFVKLFNFFKKTEKDVQEIVEK